MENEPEFPVFYNGEPVPGDDNDLSSFGRTISLFNGLLIMPKTCKRSPWKKMPVSAFCGPKNRSQTGCTIRAGFCLPLAYINALDIATQSAWFGVNPMENGYYKNMCRNFPIFVHNSGNRSSVRVIRDRKGPGSGDMSAAPHKGPYPGMGITTSGVSLLVCPGRTTPGSSPRFPERDNIRPLE